MAALRQPRCQQGLRRRGGPRRGGGAAVAPQRYRGLGHHKACGLAGPGAATGSTLWGTSLASLGCSLGPVGRHLPRLRGELRHLHSQGSNLRPRLVRVPPADGGLACGHVQAPCDLRPQLGNLVLQAARPLAEQLNIPLLGCDTMGVAEDIASSVLDASNARLELCEHLRQLGQLREHHQGPSHTIATLSLPALILGAARPSASTACAADVASREVTAAVGGHGGRSRHNRHGCSGRRGPRGRSGRVTRGPCGCAALQGAGDPGEGLDQRLLLPVQARHGHQGGKHASHMVAIYALSHLWALNLHLGRQWRAGE